MYCARILGGGERTQGDGAPLLYFKNISVTLLEFSKEREGARITGIPGDHI